MSENKKLIVDKILIGVLASVIGAGIVGYFNSSQGWGLFWIMLLYCPIIGIITYLLLSLIQYIGILFIKSKQRKELINQLPLFEKYLKNAKQLVGALSQYVNHQDNGAFNYIVNNLMKIGNEIKMAGYKNVDEYFINLPSQLSNDLFHDSAMTLVNVLNGYIGHLENLIQKIEKLKLSK